MGRGVGGFFFLGRWLRIGERGVGGELIGVGGRQIVLKGGGFGCGW